MIDTVYALDYTVKNRIDDDSAVTEKGDDDIGMRVKKNFCGYDVAFSYVYDKWTFNMEYYRNGFGETDSSMYDFDLQTRGRVIGRDYVVPSVSCQMNGKWVLTAFVFSNLNDSSSAAGGVIEYFVNDYVEVALIPLMLTGDGTSEFGIQQDIFGTCGATVLIKISF